MNWSSSRKVIYALIFILSISLIGAYIFRGTLFPTPTCVDGKQNGYEEGIDCGGLCSKRCVSQIIPIEVIWARAVPVSVGVYDLAALISNHNVDSAPYAFYATFTVYNKSAEVIYTQRIATVPPVMGDIPIMIQNVKLRQIPGKVVVTFEEGTSYKTGKGFQSVQVRVSATTFQSTDIDRVYATIHNNTRNIFSSFPVRVILYDGEQNAVAVGETFVESLDRGEDKSLVFTWPNRLSAKPVVIKAYPILSPF